MPVPVIAGVLGAVSGAVGLAVVGFGKLFDHPVLATMLVLSILVADIGTNFIGTLATTLIQVVGIDMTITSFHLAVLFLLIPLVTFSLTKSRQLN